MELLMVILSAIGMFSLGVYVIEKITDENVDALFF